MMVACSVFPSEDNSFDAPAPEVSTLPNHALHFDGVGDYAMSGTANFPAAGAPQTISLWVRYPLPAGGVDGGDDNEAFVVLRRDRAAGVELGIRNGTLAAWTVYGERMLVQAPALPTPGTWHHVAYVLSSADGGTIASLYVDGALSASGSAQPNALTPISCWLGTFDGLSELYTGDMDEIRIWSVARSGQEIVQEMQGDVTGPQPGLVAFFDGDEIAGTRLPDQSGDGNDATLGGGDPGRMPTRIPSDLPAAVAP
jgi:hypothetical protein